MTLERVAPRCEVRDCPNRADYFWHWRSISWVPVCAEHAHDISEYVTLYVCAVAESSERLVLASASL